MTSVSGAALMALELGRVLAALPWVEIGRRIWGPRPLIEELRRIGERMSQRDASARNRLQRAIRWVDACLPGARSCYRQTLLEIALDRGAAAQPFRMGLNADGNLVSGHAWLGSRGRPDQHYDVEIEL